MPQEISLYREKLITAKVARNYLKSRGILQSADQFDLGYCDAGYFANRVIFPIYDLAGVPRNLTSRLVSNEKSTKSHLHLPKVKMDWFFNEPLLAESQDYVIVCESPIDCITLCQSSFKSVAAMGANNINKGKIEKLRNASMVYICFDNDINEAGQQAATRIGEMMIRMGLVVYNIHIPFLHGPDVNAMFTKDQSAFQSKFTKIMQKAKRFVVEKSAHRPRTGRTEKATSFDILLVATEYMELRNMGHNRYRGICPLHIEEKPSFYVDTDSNRWKCFGCGKGGDAIDLVRYIHQKRGIGLSFLEALALLQPKDRSIPHST